MKLTVLGCWAPYPRPGEACSGYLLQSGAINLMLEAGNGSFAQLTRHLNFRSLTGVVVTHFHPDHYMDLFCLRHAIEGAGRDGSMSGPVKLFIPPEPIDVYNQLAGYTKAFSVISVESLPQSTDIPGLTAKKTVLGEVSLYFIPTAHSLPGYAVLARRQGQSFFFSGDSSYCGQLEKAARGTNLLLCESSGLNKDATQLAGTHMTAGQAGALARKSGVQRLVLTHFWPEYDVRELLAQAEKAFGRSVEAAIQGQEYKL